MDTHLVIGNEVVATHPLDLEGGEDPAHIINDLNDAQVTVIDHPGPDLLDLKRRPPLYGDDIP